MTKGEMLDEMTARIKARHKDSLNQPVVHYRDMQTVMIQQVQLYEELLPNVHDENVRVVLEVRPAAAPRTSN